MNKNNFDALKVFHKEIMKGLISYTSLHEGEL